MGLSVVTIANQLCCVARHGIFYTRRITKMEKDLFDFEKAIQLDHLNLKQLKELEKLLEKIK
jgi:hypothetical protein